MKLRNGNRKAPRPPRIFRPDAPDAPIKGKYCSRAKKRKYNSRAAALRAGTQRYGSTSNAYECAGCGCWHLTRRGTPQNDNDPQLDELVDVALGRETS